jgi:hypothetical protein
VRKSGEGRIKIDLCGTAYSAGPGTANHGRFPEETGQDEKERALEGDGLCRLFLDDMLSGRM